MTFLGAAIITFAYGAIGDARCSRSLQDLMPLIERDAIDRGDVL